MEARGLRGGRGMFFVSHHPWVGVVILVVLVGLALYLARRDR